MGSFTPLLSSSYKDNIDKVKELMFNNYSNLIEIFMAFHESVIYSDTKPI